MKNIFRWTVVGILVIGGLYSTIIRFNNPNLTETELLLKILEIK